MKVDREKGIIECVDEIIKDMCKAIKERPSGLKGQAEYSNMVNALAGLLTARAYYRTAFRCFEGSRLNPHRKE